ncbi:MAG: glycosyltransferase family 2 protein [Bacteroidales bacterium]|nr:glycosyltransferase family 2 protein [Bacteroidales bacterium]
MNILVAVVILNWNGKKFLETFLQSVVNYSYDGKSKVYIVDNHSTDDSLDYVRLNFPDVEIIEFDVNHGFAKGYALSLPEINAKYYMLLNSDVEVTKNWLNPLVDLFEKDPSIAAAMPKIKSYTRKDHFEYAGAGGGFIDKFGYPFCQGRILTEIEKDTGQYNKCREIFWASGACMFLRSEVYRKAGGLDVDFFAHMEEIDLCWRIKRLGYKIYYCPESQVYHVGGGTLPNDNPRKLYYNYRNSLYLLIKNLTRTQLITIMIPRLFLDCISCSLYLMQGKFSFFMSVIRAHIRFYFRLPHLISKRKAFSKIVATNMVDQIYNKSIVFSFFIRKKKYFTELDF